MSSLTALQRAGTEVRADPGRRARIRAGVNELGIAAVVYVLYWFGRMLTQDAGDAAARNAEWVIDFERSVGAFNELTVQRWALEVPGAIEFLNRYYVLVHFPASIAFLAWVFVRRRADFPMIRTWFTLVTLAALVIHVVFPLAPPRMTAGFVDTLDVFGPDIYSNDPGGSVANQFAAMPSLHFGWALMVAIGVGRLTRGSTRVWMVHPAITLLAIVATGNHYWIDAAVAGLLVMAAVRWFDVAQTHRRGGTVRGATASADLTTRRHRREHLASRGNGIPRRVRAVPVGSEPLVPSAFSTTSRALDRAGELP